MEPIAIITLAAIGAVITLIGALVEARVVKYLQVKKLLALLEAGRDITTALSQVRLTKRDVEKIVKKQ